MLVLNARVSAGETLTAAPPHATSSSSSAGKRRKMRRRTTTRTTSWREPCSQVVEVIMVLPVSFRFSSDAPVPLLWK